MNYMNKVLHSIFFLLTGVLLTSCIEINDSGYSDLKESEKQHVKKSTSNLGTLQNDGNLYQITAEQVKEYIQKGNFPIPETNTFPMLVINNQVLGTDNYKEYSDKFSQQLIGSDGQSQEGSYHLFSDGKYTRSIVSLTDFNSMFAGTI